MSTPRAVSCNTRQLLHGAWEFAPAAAGSDFGQHAQLSWRALSHPATAAASLRALGEWDFDCTRAFDAEDFWWRCRFEQAEADAVLGFDGLATLADVWLDGEHLLGSDNMFRAHACRSPQPGPHELLIRCRALAPELAQRRPRPRWRVPMLREQQLRWFRTSLLGRTPGWSPPCPAVGPWRDIWIEQRRLDVIATTLKVELVEGRGRVRIALDLGDGVDAAELVVAREGFEQRQALAGDGRHWQGVLEVEAPSLWWPHTHGEPALYAIVVEVRQGGAMQRIDYGLRGFRRIELEREDGDFAIRVNGVPVFCRGACWTPLDPVSLRATPAEHEAAVAQCRAAGFNMLRIGGTMVYPEPDLLDALDRHGVLLWQDLMFANMDYPDDPAFVDNVGIEVGQVLDEVGVRPCLALICGNSEGGQQAAMSGAGREAWLPPLFHQTLAHRIAIEGIAYTPSSTHGGQFPHASDHGAASYYGVGAYLRPLADARLARVRFASECLAFANVPADSGLPEPGLRVHHPLWKARSPRDLGAGWDFDDVRDHYMNLIYAIDPAQLRVSDHERYLRLGRAATAEVMAATFAEWRRAGSATRGALVWFLRDLWPGAGWGLIDAHGTPKTCYHALRRVLAPVAVSLADEGVNGYQVHIHNERAQPLSAELVIDLHRDDGMRVGQGRRTLEVPARTSLVQPVLDLFDGFLDLNFAYRFGPPLANLVHACLFDAQAGLIAETFAFPAGRTAQSVSEVGLSAECEPGVGDSGPWLHVRSERLAESVDIDLPGFQPEDNGFHLAPGQSRRIALRPLAQRRPGKARGHVSALNGLGSARIEIA